jgi:hypothetical protein
MGYHREYVLEIAHACFKARDVTLKATMVRVSLIISWSEKLILLRLLS